MKGAAQDLRGAVGVLVFLLTRNAFAIINYWYQNTTVCFAMRYTLLCTILISSEICKSDLSLLFPFHHTPFTYITQPSCYGHYQTISSIRKHCQATLSSWPPHNQSGQQRSGSRAQIHTPRTWVSTGLKWALDAYGYFWQRTWPPPLGNASPARCLSNMGPLTNIAVNNPVESILNY